MASIEARLGQLGEDTKVATKSTSIVATIFRSSGHYREGNERSMEGKKKLKTSGNPPEAIQQVSGRLLEGCWKLPIEKLLLGVRHVKMFQQASGSKEKGKRRVEEVRRRGRIQKGSSVDVIGFRGSGDGERRHLEEEMN
ncbi:unnamed protein product [Caenorhabditis auriculariae]|uniref:Uncharacterized protein n=1 Tax=Caenorhabditis auriculariae TaxID=2777116 RepID=A0A8S1H3C6_9PELO|nr:unnamed protein product [Caenorhabditis auriculariae]